MNHHLPLVTALILPCLLLSCNKQGDNGETTSGAVPHERAEPITGAEAGERQEFEIYPGVSIAFRWCPAGSFTMGSPLEDRHRQDDEDQHQVTLTRGYWIAETECTQGQWMAVMGKNRSHFPNAGENAPVENVSWDDVQGFLGKVNDGGTLPKLTRACLPTEAQWEYACRAGTTTMFSSGEHIIEGENNCPGLGKIAWYGGNSKVTYDGGVDRSHAPDQEIPHKWSGTHDVGTRQPNAWGIHDMHGNISEWCSDWYDEAYYLTSTSMSDPLGPESGEKRVFRGGCWYTYARTCRSADRVKALPDTDTFCIGFRPVLVVEE